MDEWVCDDRYTPEERKKQWELIHAMTEEEFEEYLKSSKG